jgi:hypothetical protein
MARFEGPGNPRNLELHMLDTTAARELRAGEGSGGEWQLFASFASASVRNPLWNGSQGRTP